MGGHNHLVKELRNPLLLNDFPIESGIHHLHVHVSLKKEKSVVVQMCV